MNFRRLRTAYLTGGLSEAARLLDRSDPIGKMNILAPARDAIAAIALDPPPPTLGLSPSNTIGRTLPHGPPGWLARAVEFGGRALMFQVEYMLGTGYGKHYHPLPMMAATRSSKSNVGSGYQSGENFGVDCDWSRNTLMTSRFVEPPAPCFPRCSPLFLLPKKYDYAASYEDAYGSKQSRNGGFESEWERALQFVDPSGINWGLSSELQIAAGAGWSVDADGCLLIGGERVYPANRVWRWCQKQTELNFGNARQFSHAASAIKATAGEGAISRPVVVPPYWRTRLDVFVPRLARWYRNAQWLAYCGAVLYANLPTVNGWPSWYRDHMLAWGLGATEIDRWGGKWVQSGGITGGPHVDPSGLRIKYREMEPGLSADMSRSACLEILREIVRHTPPPGTPGWMGEQIRSNSEGRTLCDMPEQVGSILPPVDLLLDDGKQWWAAAAIAKWDQHGSNWLASIAPYVDIAISIAGSGVGSAATSAISSITTNVIKSAFLHVVVNLSLQAVQKLGRGQNPFGSFGDVVGVIGTALDASGFVDDLAIDNMPAGLWDALKTAGAAIPTIPGTDWSEVGALYGSVQSKLTEIQGYGWNYIDEAFGGMGLTAEAKKAAQNQSLPTTNLFG